MAVTSTVLAAGLYRYGPAIADGLKQTISVFDLKAREEEEMAHARAVLEQGTSVYSLALRCVAHPDLLSEQKDALESVAALYQRINAEAGLDKYRHVVGGFTKELDDKIRHLKDCTQQVQSQWGHLCQFQAGPAEAVAFNAPPRRSSASCRIEDAVPDWSSPYEALASDVASTVAQSEAEDLQSDTSEVEVASEIFECTIWNPQNDILVAEVVGDRKLTHDLEFEKYGAHVASLTRDHVREWNAEIDRRCETDMIFNEACQRLAAGADDTTDGTAGAWQSMLKAVGVQVEMDDLRGRIRIVAFTAKALACLIRTLCDEIIKWRQDKVTGWQAFINVLSSFMKNVTIGMGLAAFIAIFETLCEDPDWAAAIIKEVAPWLYAASVFINVCRLLKQYLSDTGEIPTLHCLFQKICKEVGGSGGSLVGAKIGAALCLGGGPIGVVLGAFVGAYLGRVLMQKGIQAISDWIWPQETQINALAKNLDCPYHILGDETIIEIQYVVFTANRDWWNRANDKVGRYEAAVEKLDQHFKWFALSCSPRCTVNVTQSELERRFVRGHTAFMKLKKMMLEELPVGVLGSLEKSRIRDEEKEAAMEIKLRAQKEAEERKRLAIQEEHESLLRSQQEEHRRQQEDKDRLIRTQQEEVEKLKQQLKASALVPVRPPCGT